MPSKACKNRHALLRALPGRKCFVGYRMICGCQLRQSQYTADALRIFTCVILSLSVVDGNGEGATQMKSSVDWLLCWSS